MENATKKNQKREAERGKEGPGLVWDFDNGMNAKYFWWGCTVAQFFSLNIFSDRILTHFFFEPGNKFYNKIYYVLRLIPVWHKVPAPPFLPALTRLPLTWSQSRRLNAVTWYVFPLSISDVRRLSRRKNHLLNVYRERVLPKPAWVRTRSQHWGYTGGFAWIRRHDRDEVLWSLSS